MIFTISWRSTLTRHWLKLAYHWSSKFLVMQRGRCPSSLPVDVQHPELTLPCTPCHRRSFAIVGIPQLIHGKRHPLFESFKGLQCRFILSVSSEPLSWIRQDIRRGRSFDENSVPLAPDNVQPNVQWRTKMGRGEQEKKKRAREKEEGGEEGHEKKARKKGEHEIKKGDEKRDSNNPLQQCKTAWVQVQCSAL